MNDLDIRYYVSILLRRLPLFVAIVSVTTLCGLAMAYLMPPVYRASAKVLVEAPQIPEEMARPTVLTSAVEQLQIIEQEITTRENLLALASRLDIYGPRLATLTESEIVDNLRARTEVRQLQLDTPPGGRGATIFGVSFDARDPELPAKVVNELVAFMLDKNRGLRIAKAEDTMRFFTREVMRLSGELTRLEGEVLEFRNAHKEALADSIDFRRMQQSNQQERLLLLEREEAALRVRRSNLVAMYETTGQVATAGPLSMEQQMLQDLKRALAEQLSIFSEKSPNVMVLRARIDALQDANQQSPDKAAGPSELTLQLSEIDERLGFIAREKSAIDRNLGALTVSIDATPGNESRLNALQRSRENIQSQYNTAVAKLAEASTGEQIELGSRGGRFTVVEEARPPETAVSPNRRRIAGAGLAIGLALGLGTIVLLELTNRTVRRPKELADLLQTPPLGTIPYIWRDGEKAAINARLGMGFAAAVAAVVLLALATQHYRQPLETAFEQFVVAINPSRMM